MILDKYDKPINENILPHTLTYLVLGDTFNQPLLKNVTPDKLTHLALYGVSEFNNVLELPESLTYLDLGIKFNQPLKVFFD